jgi:hypothetical protein
MMTLSAIAYLPFRSFTMLQDNLNAAEALEQAYSVIWCAKDNDTLAYVVKSELTGEYVIVFRGPVFKPGLSFLFNLYEDLILNRQEYLSYGQLGEAKVAAGILKSLQNINNSTYSGRTLQQVLNNFPKRTKVYVTGHSLGGSLAAAYAAKAASSNPAESDIIPYTFGAPAVGNHSFANLFDTGNEKPLFTQTSRCVNVRDIMPYLWNDLQGMLKVDCGNAKSTIDFSLCIECMVRLLIVSRVFYVQPPVRMELKGEVGHDDGFFQEVLDQHQPNTYLSLLGLKPIDNAKFHRNERRELLLEDSL